MPGLDPPGRATLGVDRFSKSRCSRLYQETERSAIFRGFVGLPDSDRTGQGWGDGGGGGARDALPTLPVPSAPPQAGRTNCACTAAPSVTPSWGT